MSNKKQDNSIVLSISRWIFLGLLAYMPLHIFISTWIGSSFGILETLRVLKDIVMIFGFALALFASSKNYWFKRLIKDKLVLLIIFYGLLTLILALFRPTDMDAEILGVVYNTRFLVFFLYALLLSQLIDRKKLIKNAITAVLASSLVVLTFGLIQYTVLPNSALEHVGYTRSNGVLPVFLIDDKPDLERVMSTIRDPNSYGSYLIIIISLALVLLLKKPRFKQLALGFIALGVLNLVFTFSRSAWIGSIVSVLLILAYNFRSKLEQKVLKKLIILLSVGSLLFISVLALSWNSYFVQNVVFHADQSTVLEDPNELRIRFWKESISSVAENPVGSGPGTAGLTSIRNNVQGTELNENYYLQIASEVGVIGVGLFLAIIGFVGYRLYRLADSDWLALALLASLAGLMITNFLVHIWSNEAVAYTWWALAGIVLLGRLNASPKKRNSKSS